MENPADEQALVSSFLEIAVGQPTHTARQFLQATNWQLDEAIQLFYIENDGDAAANLPQPDAPLHDPVLSGPVNGLGDENVVQGDDVRPPLPVKREVLYDRGALFYGRGPRMASSSQEEVPVVPFRNFEEEMKRPGVWGGDRDSARTVDTSRDNLASLYRPPFGLMFHGPFEKVKDASKRLNKWLLVNLQSTREFSSHMLNRDTWANEAVAQTIKNNFIFWQVYDDTEEGSKVCTYYNIESVPVVMVLDPLTGQKMHSWRGMVQPETLLEDLLPYMDENPKDHFANLSHKRPRESSQAPPQIQANEKEDEEILRALAVSMEGLEDGVDASQKEDDGATEAEAIAENPTYPPLPEEPKADRSLLCRVGVRLPNGRRIQRNFLSTDPIQLLWSFCCSELEEAKLRLFRLSHAIPGSHNFLDYDSNSTFKEAGLGNSMISFSWE